MSEKTFTASRCLAHQQRKHYASCVKLTVMDSLNFLCKITEIVTKSLPKVSVGPSGHLGFFNVETPRRSVRAVTAHLSISVEKTDEILNASIYYPKK
jgi:hypothetical protein